MNEKNIRTCLSLKDLQGHLTYLLNSCSDDEKKSANLCFV